MSAKSGFFAPRLNAWARRRHGVQRSPVKLGNNRLYILPSRSGLVFALMLLVMLLGSMNYNNSMGLGLSFFLGSIMLVTMHHCHRNLLGLSVTYQVPAPVFAKQHAKVHVALHNTLTHTRSDIVAHLEHTDERAVNVEPQQSTCVTLNVPAITRGVHTLPRLSIRSRYPAGLFRTWTWIYWDAKLLVYPEPIGDQPFPGTGYGDESSSTPGAGDEDFAELRSYQRGDPLNRVAWKHYARTGQLHSKSFEGSAGVELWLDWSAVAAHDPEERLSQLCVWVMDADERQLNYGLRLPGTEHRPDTGAAHRNRCLKALALYGVASS
ncbi:MAG: DUF58 domain-containing protein [Pseudomonadota bacterium]